MNAYNQNIDAEDIEYVEAEQYDEDNLDNPETMPGGAGNELMVYTQKQELMVRTQKITKKVSMAGVITVPILALIILIALISGIVAIKKLDKTTLTQDLNQVVTSKKSKAKTNATALDFEPKQKIEVQVRSLKEAQVNFSQYFTSEGKSFEYQAYEENVGGKILEGARVSNNIFNFKEIYNTRNDQASAKKFVLKVINKVDKKHTYVAIDFKFNSLFEIHTLGEGNSPLTVSVSKETLIQRLDLEKNLNNVLHKLVLNDGGQAEGALKETNEMKLDHQEWYLDDQRTERFNPATIDQAIAKIREINALYASERNRNNFIDELKLIYATDKGEKDQPSVYTNLNGDPAKNVKATFDYAKEQFYNLNKDSEGNSLFKEEIRYYTLTVGGEKRYVTLEDNKVVLASDSQAQSNGLGKNGEGRKYTIYLEADRIRTTFNFYEAYDINKDSETLISNAEKKNIEIPQDGTPWNLDSFRNKFIDGELYKDDLIYNLNHYQIGWQYRNKNNELKDLKDIDANNDIDKTSQTEVRVYPVYKEFAQIKVTYKEGNKQLSDNNYFTLKGRWDQKISDTIAYRNGAAKGYKTEELLGSQFPYKEVSFNSIGLFANDTKINETKTFEELQRDNNNQALSDVEIRYNLLPVNASYELEKASGANIQKDLISEEELWIPRDKTIYDVNDVMKNSDGEFDKSEDYYTKASVLNYFAKDLIDGKTKVKQDSDYYGNALVKDADLNKKLEELTLIQRSNLKISYALNKLRLTFKHFQDGIDTKANETMELSYGQTFTLAANEKDNFNFIGWYFKNKDQNYREITKDEYQNEFRLFDVTKAETVTFKDSANAYYQRKTTGKVVINHIYTSELNNEKAGGQTKTTTFTNVPLGLTFKFNIAGDSVKIQQFEQSEIKKEYDLDQTGLDFYNKQVKPYQADTNPLTVTNQYKKEFFELDSNTKTELQGSSKKLDDQNLNLEYSIVYSRKKVNVNVNYDQASSTSGKSHVIETFLGKRLTAGQIQSYEIVDGYNFKQWRINNNTYPDKNAIEAANIIITNNSLTIRAEYTNTEVAIYPYYIKSNDLRSEDNKFVMNNNSNGSNYEYVSSLVEPILDGGKHKPMLVPKGTSINADNAKYRRPSVLPQELAEAGFDFLDGENTTYMATYNNATFDDINLRGKVLVPLKRKQVKINFQVPNIEGYATQSVPTNYLWLAGTKINAKELLEGVEPKFVGDGTNASAPKAGLNAISDERYLIDTTHFYLVKNGQKTEVSINDFALAGEDITIEPKVIRKQAKVNIYSIDLDENNELPEQYKGKTDAQIIEMLKSQNTNPTAVKFLNTKEKHDLTTYMPNKLGYLKQFTKFNKETQEYTYAKQELDINAADTTCEVLVKYSRKMIKVTMYKQDGMMYTTDWYSYQANILDTIPTYYENGLGDGIWYRYNNTTKTRGNLVHNTDQLIEDIELIGAYEG